MSRVVHFEIHADDPERAVRFYHQVFGWTITKWDGPTDYWPITTGTDNEPGINGAIMKRQTGTPTYPAPLSAFVCTVRVVSVEQTIDQIEKYGGGIELPKQAIPGVGWLAYCKDTEGNIFGIMSPDSQAR